MVQSKIIMRETVLLITLGNSIGFTLSPALIAGMGLEKGDLIQVTILKKVGDKESISDPVITTRPLMLIGGASLGIIVRAYIIRELGLEQGDLIEIEIKSAKST